MPMTVTSNPVHPNIVFSTLRSFLFVNRVLGIKLEIERLQTGGGDIARQETPVLYFDQDLGAKHHFVQDVVTGDCMQFMSLSRVSQCV